MYAATISSPTPAELAAAAGVLDSLGADSAEPLVVRDLARCVRRVMLADVPVPLHTEFATLSYEGDLRAYQLLVLARVSMYPRAIG